jgi:hypothetical protein
MASMLQRIAVGDAAPGEIEAFVRQVAPTLANPIDPNVALRVIKGEGGFRDPFQRSLAPAPRSQAPGLGDRENSYGPMQLYVSGTGAGLGDRAMAAGIDPRKDWKAATRFGLEEASRKGWGQWYGAKAQGITGFQGIGGRPANGGPGPGPASPASKAQPQSVGSAVASAVLDGPAADTSLKTPGKTKAGGLSFGSPRQTAPAELPNTQPAAKRDLSGLVQSLASGTSEPLRHQPPQVTLATLDAYNRMA